ncbi:MAG TPA: class I SAM-dependent RNA methyltransferase [Hyphomonadaceae bacterium]|nr:class I SAM-dependent RNA methyltransferase [Hyphomonadaceae bacterium]
MSAGPVTLTIDRLGAQGDGVATHDGKQVFAPLTLAGEIVTAEIDRDRARVIEITTPSADRVAPRCPHYGECGGCSLQHLADARYLEFKREQVVTALSFLQIDTPVDPVIAIAPRSRRRAVFAAHRVGKAIAIGFHSRRSHRIVPITDCAVVTPSVLALLPKLERIAAICAPPKDALTVSVTETITGFDVALNGVAKAFRADGRIRAIQTAGEIGLARLSINGDVAMERAAPTLRAGAAHLTPPPGGFLQACEASEAAMLALVKEAIGDSRKVVDLFAGSGTFSLPLASTATIHAVEGDEAALASLDRAARKAQGLKPVTVEKRDLFRRPLTRADLKRFDAAIIDPPRAGAEDQTRELAASTVKRVAMVSCNAQTFARDLQIMASAGWRATRITPIDQFLWSPHIEVVAQLRRG